MKTISAAEANRRFSNLLRDVATGTIITVLSRGKPVATIGPANTQPGSQKSARLQLLNRLRSQKATGARNWTRDELYEG